MSFPKYGSIFSRYSGAATTADGAIAATRTALIEFWQQFLSYFSFAKFAFKGTAVTGPTAVTIAGKFGGLNSSSQINIPDSTFIKQQLQQSSSMAFIGLFKLFSYTLSTSLWQIDCKIAGFSTPMPATLPADFTAQAMTFKTKMFGLAPATHEDAMDLLSTGVTECLQSYVCEVPYVGSAGTTQLTGTMTIQFK